MVFHEGQRYVVLRDISAICVVSATNMVMEEHTVVIPAGEVFVLGPILLIKPNQVWCRPHRYDDFEAEFVDQETRQHPEYQGYSLALEDAVIERDCRLLEPAS